MAYMRSIWSDLYVLIPFSLPVLTAVPGSNSVSITGAWISGTLTDLYDFNLEQGGDSEKGARVQAGYPTMGTTGAVFEVWVPLAAAAIVGPNSPVGKVVNFN